MTNKHTQYRLDSRDERIKQLESRVKELEAQKSSTIEIAAGAVRVVVDCAGAYMAAVHGLGKIVDGKTLFEHSPTKNEECYRAFINLNNTGARLRECLDKVRKPLPEPPK